MPKTRVACFWVTVYNISFCRAMLCKCGFSRHAVSVCPSVRLSVRPSRSWILSKRINISSKLFTIRLPCHSSSSTLNGMAIFRREPRNRGVECRWGRQKSRFLANIWLHCGLWTVPTASAIHLAATDHGEFMTLVAGKRRSLSMARDDDKVFMTRSLDLMLQTTEQH